MAISKQIRVDGKDITIRELRVKDVLKAFDLMKADTGPEGASGMLAMLDALLPLAAPGLSRDELTELAPSEINELWTAFKEVNSVFFVWMGKVGVMRGVDEALKKFAETFVAGLADSFDKGTEPSGTTPSEDSLIA